MGFSVVRASALSIAALVASCSVDEVSLDGKECPCVAGWVCDMERLVCVRPTVRGDGGAAGDGSVARDSGPDAGRADAGANGVDGGSGDTGDGVPDAGSDAGPPDGGTPRSATVQIVRSYDDAEECLDGTSGSDGPGSIYVGSTDLELVNDPTGTYCVGLQLVGLRFDVVPIPRNATITEAYVEFVVDEVRSDPTSLVLAAQAADNPASFSLSVNDLSDRTLGSARVAWPSVPVWSTEGEVVRSPDLSPLIEEVTGRPGWTAGNALVILIEGSGRRVVESWDGDAAAAARLSVSWIE